MDGPEIIVFPLVIIALIMLVLWWFLVIIANIGILLIHLFCLFILITIMSTLIIAIMLFPLFLFNLYKINKLNSLDKIQELVSLNFVDTNIKWRFSHFTVEEYLNKTFATIYAFFCCPLAIGIIIHRLYYTGLCDISININNYGTVCKIALIWWAFPGSNSSDEIIYIEPIISLSCSAILSFISLFLLEGSWISQYYEVTQKSIESKIDSLVEPINQSLSNNNNIKEFNKIKSETEKISRKLHIPVKNTNLLEKIRDYIPVHKQELSRGRYEGLNYLIENLLTQVQEEYKYLSQADKAYEDLIIIKKNIENVGVNLDIALDTNFIKTEISNYIEAHKQELSRGKYNGLNHLIRNILSQAQEEYKYLSQADKAYEDLIIIKKNIENVGVNLDIALDTNFIKTEISNYIEAHKQELSRGKYNGLNNLIRNILSQAQEEYRYLSEADKAYEKVLSFYKHEVVKRVNNAGSIPLILELEQVYEGLCSENLKDIIKDKNWHKFHDILQLIQEDLERLKNLAIKYEREVYEDFEESIPYSDIDTETDEEKAYRILGVPATATDDFIKKAYRGLASLWHPDAGLVKDDSKIKEINWAYDILKNLRGL